MGLLLLFLLIHTCEQVEPDPLLLVSTDTISDITLNNIFISGTILHMGEKEIQQHGFCWSDSPHPSITQDTTTDLGSRASAGIFTDTVDGLEPNTTYFIRAYAKDPSGTVYGKEKSFTTLPQTAPIVATMPITGITLENAISGGEIIFYGGSEITSKGVCWNTLETPTVLDNFTNEGGGEEDFVSILNRLNCGTTYYVRAYATNSFGTGYGDQISFSTIDCPVGLPVVLTTSVSAITETYAVAGGEVTDEGNSAVNARGLCWSTHWNPVLSDPHTFEGGGSGIFSSTMTELTCGTSYYFRAYATNDIGTSYGPIDSFQTSPCPIYKPTVNTGSVTDISETSARGGGEVIEDGGSPVTAKGICWGTSSEPTLDDHYTVNGSGTGSFVSQMSGLECGTSYYVRAYATNAAGTAYGSDIEFRTGECTYLDPTVSTQIPTDVTQTSFQAGGNVTDDGGAEIMAKGVCWSTHQNPTLLDDYTDEGPGGGSFTSYVDGLMCGTTYYLKAYATNSSGTAYGARIEITTSLCLSAPTVHTTAVTEITEQSAICGGEVTDNGNLQVTARGICWSESSEPTTSDNKSDNGIGVGTYSYMITGLAPTTTYYVRAYATNIEGTSYGEEASFTTWQGSVTDYDGNRYPTVQIGDQTWMAVNLKVSHFPDGTDIPYVPGYDEWDALDLDGKAYCWYRNDIENLETYGALYNWAAAANGTVGSDTNPSGIQGVCPDGWHLPSHAEWLELELFIGMSPDHAYYEGWDGRGTIEGGLLKQQGQQYWTEQNVGATNETEFTALPGGERDTAGYYMNLGFGSYFWTATIGNSNVEGTYRALHAIDTYIEWGSRWMNVGFSVRCVKDE